MTQPENVRRDGEGEVTVAPDAPLPQLVENGDGRRVWRIVTTIECTAARHDTISAYKNCGCRCPAAGRRAVAYEKRRQAGFVAPNEPADLTMLRLQALAVIGWTSGSIAALVGRNSVSISEIRRGGCEMVTGRTAAAVHKVYRRLCNEPGPSDRSRAHAARQQWAGPSVLLLYNAADDVKIARAIRGEAADLSRGERLEVVRQLRSHGYGYPQIAERLRVAERQVHRDLTDLGLVDRKETVA